MEWELEGFYIKPYDTLITNSNQYTLIAEPVTSPFSIENAEFFLNNSEHNNNKETESQSRSFGQSNDTMPLMSQNEKSPSEWNTQHLTVNTSKHMFLLLFSLNQNDIKILSKCENIFIL